MVEVVGNLNEKYTIENKTKEHSWIVDEPKSIGGLDLGPKPDEVLLSALVSCKAITMKMYAERKGWDVQNVSVKLRMGEKIGDKTEIEKSIKIEGELDESQLARLIDVSGRCPMAKLVANSIEFKLVK